MKNIAIIPARSGSKGLKDKNIKLLNGKPLMAYTIESAIRSEVFNEIFVSTDSPEYARVARQYGASVPFLRNESLSTDTASSWDVVRSVLMEYEAMGSDFDSFTLLQPTSPLRRSEHIVATYELLGQKKANAIVGVTEAEHSPLLYGTLPPDQSLVGFLKNEQVYKCGRQGLEPYFRINGAIYTVMIDYFQRVDNIYANACYAYIMDRESSVDIDTAVDFLMAEFIMKKDFVNMVE